MGYWINRVLFYLGVTMHIYHALVGLLVAIPVLVGYFVAEWFASQAFHKRYFILNPNQLYLRVALIMGAACLVSFLVWLLCYLFVLS